MKNNYRIFRTDSRNIAIQKQWPAGDWRTISYHGHSTNSLVSGLFELVMSEYTPNDDNLLESLEKMQLALDMNTDTVKKICADFGEKISA